MAPWPWAFDPVCGMQKRTFSAQGGDAYLSGLASPVVGSKLGSRYRWQAEDASNLHTSGSGPALKFSLGAARGYCRRGP